MYKATILWKEKLTVQIQNGDYLAGQLYGRKGSEDYKLS